MGGRIVTTPPPSALTSTPTSGAAAASTAFTLSASTAVIRIRICRPSGASARNVWPVEVAGLESHGDQIRADLTGELRLAADLTTASAAELGLHPGAAVWATVKATQTHAYPA